MYKDWNCGAIFFSPFQFNPRACGGYLKWGAEAVADLLQNFARTIFNFKIFILWDVSSRNIMHMCKSILAICKKLCETDKGTFLNCSHLESFNHQICHIAFILMLQIWQWTKTNLPTLLFFCCFSSMITLKYCLQMIDLISIKGAWCNGDVRIIKFCPFAWLGFSWAADNILP